jgi:hypothetical protein
MGEARKRAKAQNSTAQLQQSRAAHLLQQLHVCTHKKVSSQLPVKKKSLIIHQPGNHQSTPPPPHHTHRHATRPAGRHTPQAAALRPSPPPRLSRLPSSQPAPPVAAGGGTAGAISPLTPKSPPHGHGARARNAWGTSSPSSPAPRLVVLVHSSSRRTGPRNQGSARRSRPSSSIR